MKIDNTQIARIKIEVKRLGLDDDQYRDMLQEAHGVRSCTQLSRVQAGEFLASLQRVAPPPLPYEDCAGRPGMAQPKQLRMLMAMFADVSDAKPVEREARFRAFLKSRFKSSEHLAGGIRWVEEGDVKKIARLLRQMKKQADVALAKKHGNSHSFGLDAAGHVDRTVQFPAGRA